MAIRGWTALLVSVGAVAVVVGTSAAQQRSARSQAPRTAEQIQRDTAECRAAATRTTGYDPIGETAGADGSASKPAAGRRARGAEAYQDAYRSCLVGRGYNL